MGRERCIGFKGATFRNSSSSVEEYLTKKHQIKLKFKAKVTRVSNEYGMLMVNLRDKDSFFKIG